ncbi:acyltransferase domain-containing protein [Herbaspirillum sp. LeCh32-8]|uniref:ACP S-malonyltransferase n=1 Tax=Herbaspirillum sp. LeCh32-8 TaxID=2821356 RepID=UPI001AE5EC5B|nr:acyltransferase domain-containing protein [Herbaspirillum sp. LeCh32-8]MBP0599457.1 acyltransferase domain-containing protein [Herbaspirillum sp. LeCh32-8]
MNMRLAILCPGQCGQQAAMFDLARADARGGAFLERCQWPALLDAPLDVVLSDPARLFANRNAQPLIVAAQLAAWHAISAPLAEIAGSPTVVAGYSVGELSACAVAGVLDAEQTIALAAQRARCMDEAAAALPAQGLMSVGGVAVGLARACLQRHGAGVAIDTGEDSLIAGGPNAALQAAAVELQAQGARTGELPVGLASHTPLMQAAVAPFSAALAQVAGAAPSATLLAGVSGQAVADAAQARQLLVRQLTETIQWAACMDACAERGVTVALELGPGSALTRMLRERHPQIACRSLADFRSLDGALAWLRRQAD